MNEIFKFIKSRNFKAVLGMVIGTIIYCLGVVWILNLGQFFGGGVTGISQILTSIVNKTTKLNVSMSIFVVLLNFPLLLIGWKGVSKRFALLTLGSVVLQSLCIALIEYITNKYHINPFANFINGEVVSKFDMLTLSILGGLVCGVGAGISLRFGASTGGVDIISQYFSFKKNTNFAQLSLFIDLAIIGVTCLMPELLGGVEIAVYTVIRFIISILVLDKIHTIYKKVRISIVTSKVEEMRRAMISKFNHGITIYEAIGGYSLEKKYVLETVVSSFEIEDYRKLSHEIDKNVFISYEIIAGIDGKFNKNPIA